MTDPTERRAYPRTDARLAVGVRPAGRDDALAVTTLNVGAGGVYVEVPRYIEPLTKLEITLELPTPDAPDGATRIETDAIVVRTQPDTEAPGVRSYEIACAFIALAEPHRRAIQRWVAAQRAPAPSGS